jgi:hypothetical protein
MMRDEWENAVFYFIDGIGINYRAQLSQVPWA